MNKIMQTIIVFKDSKPLETGDLVIRFIMVPTSVAHIITNPFTAKFNFPTHSTVVQKTIILVEPRNRILRNHI